MSAAPLDPSAPARVFRLPRSAYLIVLFLVFCTVPLALTRDAGMGSPAAIGPRALLMLIPVTGALYIARTATVVDESGIQVRALFGSRQLPWHEVRGLSVSQRAVYAVCVDGSVRLPCVRVADLSVVSEASGGRLPEIAAPKPKYAPSKRGRR